MALKNPKFTSPAGPEIVFKVYPIKEKTKLWYETSRAFLREVWIETNPYNGKVSWPSKKAILGSTIAVLISVVIFSLYLGIVDYISLRIMMLLVR